MLFGRGVVKAPELVISDRRDFTDSGRRQRQNPGRSQLLLQGPVLDASYGAARAAASPSP